MAGRITIFALFVTAGLLAVNYPQGRSVDETTDASRLAECATSYADSIATHRVVDLKIPSGGIELSAQLYLPSKERLADGARDGSAAVVLMHGGGNNFAALMSTPRYIAPRLAHCGIAALAYHKRGTGESGGDYGTSTFDDFVDDVGNAARYIGERADVDASRIGVLGFSQGGRLAPVAAVRYSNVSFAASVSGPFVSVLDTRMYALENSFRAGGMPDANVARVMPLWREHLVAIGANDLAALQALDPKIDELDGVVHPNALPPHSDEPPVSAIHNSLGRDYTAELSRMTKPWFVLFGEQDIVVPVEASIEVLHRSMAAAGNTKYDLHVIPSVGHSYVNSETNEFFSFEPMVITWILDTTSSLL